MAKVAAKNDEITPHPHSQRRRGETATRVSERMYELPSRAEPPSICCTLEIAHHKLWGQMPGMLGVIKTPGIRASMSKPHYPSTPLDKTAELLDIIPRSRAHEGGMAPNARATEGPIPSAPLEKEIKMGFPGGTSTTGGRSTEARFRIVRLPIRPTADTSGNV